MSEDINNKLQQLKEMLNNDQMSDNLKGMLDLMSSNSSKDKSNFTNNLAINNPIFNTDNEVMIQKLKKIIDKKDQINDPRIFLLNAIKPYVNPKRQQKIDSYTKMLNLTVLSSILKDEEL